MAVITLPTGLAIAKRGVRWGQRRFDVIGGNDATGNIQDRLGAPPRWSLSLRAPDAITAAEAQVWRAMLLQLRGRVNYLLAWNPAQVAPRGTMRGTMTLNASASAGATSVVITAGAGEASKTILSGSPLTIGSGLGTSQLVHTVSDATANGSGVITVTVEPPLRMGFSSATAVTWDKAAAYFKTVNDATAWDHYDGALHQDFALDLLETWN